MKKCQIHALMNTPFHLAFQSLRFNRETLRDDTEYMREILAVQSWMTTQVIFRFDRSC